MTETELAPYLRPTACVESDAPPCAPSPRASPPAPTTARERAVRLFYAVRDEIRYDPYGVVLTEDGLRATTVLERGAGFCVAKAVRARRRRAGVRHPGPSRLRRRPQPSHDRAPARPDGHRRLRLPRLHRAPPRRPLGEGDADVQPVALRSLRREATRVRRAERQPAAPVRQSPASATWSTSATAARTSTCRSTRCAPCSPSTTAGLVAGETGDGRLRARGRATTATLSAGFIRRTC